METWISDERDAADAPPSNPRREVLDETPPLQSPQHFESCFIARNRDQVAPQNLNVPAAEPSQKRTPKHSARSSSHSHSSPGAGDVLRATRPPYFGAGSGI